MLIKSFKLLVQKDYYLFNKIFNHKNVKLKNLIRIHHKVDIIGILLSKKPL